MENNLFKSPIKSKYCFEIIFSYIKNDNFKYRLFLYSKYFQRHFGIEINNYKIKCIDNLKKYKGEKEFFDNVKIIDKLNLIKIKSKDFLLVNSIRNFIFPLPGYWTDQCINHRIIPEFENLKNNILINEGFQTYGIKENKLIGVIEGPPGTSFENGFFIFEIKLSKDYPLKFGEFYFKTKIFHPNIGENGFVSLDVLANGWTPILNFRTVILSVQSLLDSPNPDDFLNEKAAKLYKENINEYEEIVKDNVMKYANFFIFEDELSKYEFKIEHFELQ